MKANKTKRYIVLSILFFLPVAFLLMLYPAQHNYVPLNVVNENVSDMENFISDKTDSILLKDHITVLGFLGKTPLDNNIAALNLKELVYDKFKGFKKFQIVIVVPEGAEEDITALKTEINTYEDLKYWHYVYGSEGEIKSLFSTLKSKESLAEDLSTNHVFIIDNNLNQRGRLDGRTEREVEDKKLAFRVYSYNTILVDEIKNMMNDDVRILFTEYRQKRKGSFEDSNSKRNREIKK